MSDCMDFRDLPILSGSSRSSAGNAKCDNCSNDASRAAINNFVDFISISYLFDHLEQGKWSQRIPSNLIAFVAVCVNQLVKITENTSSHQPAMGVVSTGLWRCSDVPDAVAPLAFLH